MKVCPSSNHQRVAWAVAVSEVNRVSKNASGYFPCRFIKGGKDHRRDTEKIPNE